LNAPNNPHRQRNQKTSNRPAALCSVVGSPIAPRPEQPPKVAQKRVYAYWPAVSDFINTRKRFFCWLFRVISRKRGDG